MTTVQSMLLRCIGGRVAALVIVAVMLLPLGCARKPELVPPEALLSPYGDAWAGTDVLWAVAPLANESGTTIADSLAISDAVVGKITEVQGLAAVPMNRTLAAMRGLSMTAVRSPADARQLAEALGVDGIIVGSITAYDPYDPPTLGLTLALFGRQSPAMRAAEAIDPRELTRAADDRHTGVPPLSAFQDAPLSVIAEHLPGANHAVQMRCREYAQGRHRHDSALGWRRYLASMELYTDFAAHWAIRRLLEQERLRVTRSAGPGRTIGAAGDMQQHR